MKKRPKNPEKKTAESVLDDKCALYFESKFAVGQGEFIFTVWALSLPMVITVHASQESQAWATIMWDSTYKEPSRLPFQIPQKGLWSSLAETLSSKFAAECGLGLTSDHLLFLRNKIFNGPPSIDQTVTWNQFCKETLPGRDHTFWEWFYVTMRFCAQWLKNMWEAGNIIIGFISRVQAEDTLRGYPVGTFLLRFSDGEPGGITIAYVGEDGEVLHIQPFSGKTFETHSLSDCVNDLAELVVLYPNTPKSVFSKYSKAQEGKRSTGNYVKPIMQITIDKKSQRSPASSPGFTTLQQMTLQGYNSPNSNSR